MLTAAVVELGGARVGVEGHFDRRRHSHDNRKLFKRAAGSVRGRATGLRRCELWHNPMLPFDPWVGLAVAASTAVTDAVYVLFNAAVSARHRFRAASWSSIWYLLSAFAVISYTHSWIYILFAATGSWLGAFVTLTFLGPRCSAGGAAELPLIRPDQLRKWKAGHHADDGRANRPYVNEKTRSSPRGITITVEDYVPLEIQN